MTPAAFWGAVENWLRWYFQTGRPVAWRGSLFRERKGLLVLCQLFVLAALNVALACSPRLAWVAIPVVVYIGLEILVANTVIVFLTGGAVSALRSAILTLLGYFNLAQLFAAFWILSDDGTTSVPSRVLTALYESVRTLATVGPSMELMPAQKVLAILEMLIGVYFLVVSLRSMRRGQKRATTEGQKNDRRHRRPQGHCPGMLDETVAGQCLS
jgi:hypothetical protein